MRGFRRGDRVQAAPHTDAWMRGDRYGEVVEVGRRDVRVLMDRSERVLTFHPDNLIPMD